MIAARTRARRRICSFLVSELVKARISDVTWPLTWDGNHRLRLTAAQPGCGRGKAHDGNCKPRRRDSPGCDCAQQPEHESDCDQSCDVPVWSRRGQHGGQSPAGEGEEDAVAERQDQHPGRVEPVVALLIQRGENAGRFEHGIGAVGQQNEGRESGDDCDNASEAEEAPSA
jgi:hypothetical protein